jgi:hypothetical protein
MVVRAGPWEEADPFAAFDASPGFRKTGSGGFLMRAILFALITICATSALAAGDVYKWVDKNGNVHYGDKPKEGGEQLTVKPGSGSGEPSDPAAAKADADRAAACEKKKQQLQTYREAGVIKEKDALGHTREYSDQERSDLIALTEKQVGEACSPAAKPAPSQAQ